MLPPDGTGCGGILSERAGFLVEVAVVVELDEDRHYHVPLLAAPASAVSYLGA